MSKFTVIVDIDDTINNLLETWVNWLNRQYQTNIDWHEMKYFPFIGWKHVIIAYDKSMILGDVMVDDKLDNILVSRCPTRILFSAPHNMDFVTDGQLTYRARTWEDVAEIVNDVYIWSKEK